MCSISCVKIVSCFLFSWPAYGNDTEILTKKIFTRLESARQPSLTITGKDLIQFDATPHSVALHKLPFNDYLMGKNNWRKYPVISFSELGKSQNEPLINIDCMSKAFRCLLTFSDGRDGQIKNSIIEVDFSKGQKSARGFELSTAYNTVHYLGPEGAEIFFSDEPVWKAEKISPTFHIWREGIPVHNSPTVLEAPEDTKTYDLQYLSRQSGLFVTYYLQNGKARQFYIDSEGTVTEIIKLLYSETLYAKLMKNCQILFELQGRLYCKVLNTLAYEKATFTPYSIISFPLAALKKRRAKLTDVLTHFTLKQDEAFDSVYKLSGGILVLSYSATKAHNRLYFSKMHGEAMSVPTPQNGTLEITGTSGIANNALVNIETYVTPAYAYYVDFEKGLNLSAWQPLPHQPAKNPDDDYVMESRTLITGDGFELVYEIIGKQTAIHQGHAPILITAYAYDSTLNKPSYMASYIESWMANGGLVVYAHPRADGVYRNPHGNIYDTLSRRQNAVRDFVAITRELHSSGLAMPGNVHAEGSSAGASLIVTAALENPDLFSSVAAIAGCYYIDIEDGACGPYFEPVIQHLYSKGLTKNSALRAIDARKLVPSILAQHANRKGKTRTRFLMIANNDDERVPIEHSYRLEKELTGYGFQVETLYSQTGGHFLGLTNQVIASKRAQISVFRNKNTEKNK